MSELPSSTSAAATRRRPRLPLFGHPRLVLLAVIGLALALFPGCEGTFAKYSTSARVKQLHEAVTDFNKYIRWQEWERASAFVTKEDREAFKSQLHDIEDDFRITEYDIRHTEVDETESKFAETTVLYRYYVLPSVTEKKVRTTQSWVWSETDNRWEVKSPLDFLKLVERPVTKRRAVKSAGYHPSGRTR